MFKKIAISISLCICSILFAQKGSTSIKNGIDKPSTLTTHHFGIFSSRINQNFRIKPTKFPEIEISSISGNNFHPFVEAYFPKDPTTRKALSETIWYSRSFNFIDQETTPADYMNIVIDAVTKEFRGSVRIPISNKQELYVSLRSYLISRGKHPFSFFSGDETIEWFHSNIAGGEDPYGRRYYGLNQVHFKYTDRNGNILELNDNAFFIGGIELNHFYYPSFPENISKQIYLNLEVLIPI